MQVRKEHVKKMGPQPGRVFKEGWRCGGCQMPVGAADRYCRGCGTEFVRVVAVGSG